MIKIVPAAALALLTAAPAFAAPVSLLDFDTVTSFASIDQHYNGGTDSAGAAGAALGLSFGPDALGLQNDSLGPYFSHAPSSVGVMAPVGGDSALNSAERLIGAVSFWYSSSSAVLNGVQVWSGLDGTGDLLASFDLQANATTGCNDSPYCHFDQLSGSFAGVAHSLTFGNAAYVAAFDDVAVTVPEPTSALLVLLALGGVAASRRRG